eukprot:GHVP01016634.1.p1 GENE.GHVP01016634.1~~GHVP01016634.1.p1  ORF type:complete len:159 (+),score=14.58 GHVP01016634.1:654-1130(+)
MGLNFTPEEQEILTTAANGEARYGIATLSELGIEDNCKIRITVPSQMFKTREFANMVSLSDSKQHNYVSAAIAIHSSEDASNADIKVRGGHSLPLIKDVIFCCIRNCYVASVISRQNDSTYHGGFNVTYGKGPLDKSKEREQGKNPENIVEGLNLPKL